MEASVEEALVDGRYRIPVGTGFVDAYLGVDLVKDVVIEGYGFTGVVYFAQMGIHVTAEERFDGVFRMWPDAELGFPREDRECRHGLSP